MDWYQKPKLVVTKVVENTLERSWHGYVVYWRHPNSKQTFSHRCRGARDELDALRMFSEQFDIVQENDDETEGKSIKGSEDGH